MSPATSPTSLVRPPPPCLCNLFLKFLLPCSARCPYHADTWSEQSIALWAGETIRALGGAAVVVQGEPQACTACGVAWRPGTAFCQECGATPAQLARCVCGAVKGRRCPCGNTSDASLSPPHVALPATSPHAAFQRQVSQLAATHGNALADVIDLDLALDLYNDYIEPTSPTVIPELIPLSGQIFAEFSIHSFQTLLRAAEQLKNGDLVADKEEDVEDKPVLREGELSVKYKFGWKKRWFRLSPEGEFSEWVPPPLTAR